MDSTQDFVPNPSARRTRWTGWAFRVFRGYIYAAVVLLPVTTIFALRPRTDAIADAEAISNEMSGTDVATRAVIEWASSLNGSPPVWISATGTIGDDGTRVETHQFGIVIAEVPYQVAVQVATGVDGGSSVLSAPSIALAPISEETALGRVQLWPGADRYSPTSSVAAAIEAWSNAYFSGDPRQLLNVTRDPTSGRSYVPVVGFDPVDVTVDTGAVHPGGGVVVRATFELVDVDEVEVDAAFDLLVVEQDTATPAVVAWGPPGTGLTLEPYGNAVDGTQVTAPTTPTSTTTTTTTTTSTTTPPPTSAPAAPTTTSAVPEPDTIFDPFATTTTTP